MGVIRIHLIQRVGKLRCKGKDVLKNRSLSFIRYLSEGVGFLKYPQEQLKV